MMRPLALALLMLALWPAARANATCVGLNCSCSVTAAMSFGAYDPLSDTDKEANGDVAVTCGATILGGLISYDIGLGAGGGGSAATRRMLHGATPLAYQLYNPDNVVWGDGLNGGATHNFFYLLAIPSRTDHFNIRGVIPRHQPVGPGTYTDTVMVTVEF